MNNNLYYSYSKYLKDQYNEKVYKLPVNLPITCPNRLDGKGCYFCAEIGTGFESLSNKKTVRDQLIENKAYIKKKYKANKFIAYFQNYTNTFMPVPTFEAYLQECIIDDLVEISISTRPDCINIDYLKVLQEFQNKSGYNITIELGLQTVNYHSLKRINRGHTLAEYIDAVMMIKRFGFQICTHLILNLPWDNLYDVIENSKVISALGIDQVKLHSLYIANNTKLAKLFIDGIIEMRSMEDYIKNVILFLEYLNPNIAVQRLVSRAPKEETIFCNWDTSWWKIKEAIEEKMRENKTFQGKKYNYLNGSALRKGAFEIGKNYKV